ncbi:MAG TPA: GxxExxY protein [Prosthecobacter sp.]|nr:GxxExxY protein [Prosthecobacter sp.]
MQENDPTFRIIGCAMRVHSALGCGLPGKPYENALCIDLAENGFRVDQQRTFPLFYHQQPVGDCVPDLFIDDEIVVTVKSIDRIGDTEMAQMQNYLRIVQRPLGLILNFKPRTLEIKRMGL